MFVSANRWEATDALRARLEKSGIKLEGRPGGWAEMYRVFKECKVSGGGGGGGGPMYPRDDVGAVIC